MKKAILIVAFACCICGLKLYAQDNVKTLAFNAYNNKNWVEAEKYFQQIIKNSPTDTFAIYYYAMTQLKLKKYADAQQNFRNIYALNLQPDFKNESGFELAKIYAATNDRDKCIQLLNEIAANGATFAQRLNDTIFSALRTVQNFKNAEEKFKENATPCLYDDRYKKLDFFVGTWDVYIGENYTDKVAVDTVSKFYGGCSVDEKFKWIGSDYIGESISFFDNTSQRFRMCWAGKSGDVRNFEEISSAQDSIVFFAVTTYGKNLIHRKLAITYNPADETLHEHIENSYDLGKTWQPDFDALFKKAK
jgi:tetratricopeptide (TPR) repeat protein